LGTIEILFHSLQRLLLDVDLYRLASSFDQDEFLDVGLAVEGILYLRLKVFAYHDYFRS